MKRVIIVSALALNLGACASILDGTSEEVVVNTNPSGASCALNRQGATIARIAPTPAATTIKKTRDDISIVCDKDGYQEATYFEKSGTQGATWGNIVAGGLIGWGIDAASGADNYYESPVNITLAPALAAGAAPPPAAAAAPVPPAPGAPGT